MGDASPARNGDFAPGGENLTRAREKPRPALGLPGLPEVSGDPLAEREDTLVQARLVMAEVDRAVDGCVLGRHDQVIRDPA